MVRLLERLAPLFCWSCLAAILASIVTAVLQHVFVPISPDGGWYSYPGYAWAMGGDPSENMFGADLSGVGERLTATFGWENRSNLVVPITGLWFKIVPASYWSLSYFGVLQWLCISALAFAAVSLVTRDRLLALTAALITGSDSRLISEVISDARPDVPVAITALALLAALASMFKERTPLNVVLVLALAAVLPLMHVTSANSIAMLMGFVGLWVLFNRRDQAQRGALIWAAIACVLMAGVFLLRQPLADIIVPTAVHSEIEKVGQHSLLEKLEENFNFGLWLKLKMEWERWSLQFGPLNFAQLGMLVIGGLMGLSLLFNGKPDFAGRFGLAVLGALAASALFMFAVNPHHTPGHALVLAILAYAGAAAVLHSAKENGILQGRSLAGLCTVLMLMIVTLKIVHSAFVYHRFAREGISNAGIERALNDAVPRDGRVKIMGASEFWPYLAARKQRIDFVDPNRMFVPKGPSSGDYSGVSVLAVNEDHISWGWGEAIDRWQAQGLIRPLAKVGECGRTKRCLAIYAFKAR